MNDSSYVNWIANQCELTMNNKPCELWEISQNALSHLVFSRS